MAKKEVPAYILDEATGKHVLNPAYVKAQEAAAKEEAPAKPAKAKSKK